jgi:hypothetical protein
LFGTAKPVYQPPRTYQGASRLLPPGNINTGQPYTIRSAPQPRRHDDDDVAEPSARASGGGHHTVCVRMCDGFYWPVSYSAPRSRFYRDANTCSSSCGSEAKLFHYPTHGGQMQDAVDLGGRAYISLPTAFKYRKTLVQGCTCKPAPWSEAEMDRHRIYALNEAAAKGEQPAGKVAARPLPASSGQQSSALVSDATDAVDSPPTGRLEPKASAATTDGQSAAPPSRPATRVRSAEAGGAMARNRTRSASPPPQIRARTQPSPYSGGNFWAGGPSKYSWPGDAPVRMR